MPTLSMESYFQSQTVFLRNGSTVKFGLNSATFEDELNRVTVMIEKEALLKGIADFLTSQDANTINHLMAFVHSPVEVKV